MLPLLELPVVTPILHAWHPATAAAPASGLVMVVVTMVMVLLVPVPVLLSQKNEL